jgi:hypothetical protein
MYDVVQVYKSIVSDRTDTEVKYTSKSYLRALLYYWWYYTMVRDSNWKTWFSWCIEKREE